MAKNVADEFHKRVVKFGFWCGLKINFKIFGVLADKNLRGVWLKFGGFMN